MHACAFGVHHHCHPNLSDRFLEEELARRYREAAPATLALLQERCEAVAKELIALEARIQSCSDVASLRRAGAGPALIRGFFLLLPAWGLACLMVVAGHNQMRTLNPTA
jgi:hypothetical protein